MHLVIDHEGVVRCVYSEVIELKGLGRLSIRRASHVEPDGQGQWFADLSPVQGPLLGPYPQRSLALQAELDWLESEGSAWARPQS